METPGPEKAHAIVDPALKVMIYTVHCYDGYIVQSIGDGNFALFSAPVVDEDHPQRAPNSPFYPASSKPRSRANPQSHRFAAGIDGRGNWFAQGLRIDRSERRPGIAR
jgi:class 3 adenylate cyclase